MPDASVRYFDSTMAGAPALANTAGALIAVLDACLGAGFGAVTLDSLVVAGDVATATDSSGHGFTMLGATGPVLRIAGASPPALNGDWRVTVTSATTFTFATSGIADQTATGTISATRAPLGWEKAWSGTNLAAYRPADVTGARLYLRVDDTGTTNARVVGYETMSDVDTGTGPFPTAAQVSGGAYLYKASGAACAWRACGDGRLLYFFCDPANNQGWDGGLVWGDLQSYRAGDAYAVTSIANASLNSPLVLPLLNSASSAWLARSHDQTGAAIASARYSHGRGSSLGQMTQEYPAAADHALHLWPVEVWEGTDRARGLLPGLWGPVHAHTNLPIFATFDAVPGLAGRTVAVMRAGGANYRVALDVTGPWR